ncbi:MAG TPA: GDSL-type esterase/lipase family protein [Candidatus Saccharimonadales bacterium]|nr:GDSL-type esterase/lipase family protein [Candidatus Saccharimonadales bacterium]
MKFRAITISVYLLGATVLLAAQEPSDQDEPTAKTNASHRAKADKSTNTVAKAGKDSETNKVAEAIKETQPRKGIPNFFQKLEDGRSVRIAYFGGSITAQEGWRPQTLTALRQQFPNANIKQINASIGGTGSDLGVFRFRQDVLDHDPDLVFVEFAVNDAGADAAQIIRCMEGIVRQAWDFDADLDLCFVYTIAGNMLETYQAGKIPKSVAAMEKVASHYGIPSINFGVEVVKLAKEGKLLFKADLPITAQQKTNLTGKILFSPDGVHPYPESGHELYAKSVVRSIPIMRADRKPERHLVPKPLDVDNYENARLVPLSKARLSSGWVKLDPATNIVARRFHDRLPEIWKTSRPGDSLAFTFRGTSVGIYDLLGPDCGQVIFSLDDQPSKIRPRFDSFSTYHRLGALNVANGLPDRVHSVRFELHSEQPDKAAILAQRQEKMDDPRRYDDRAWYAGAIMIIGDLLTK